jgi:aldehyde dehydrogenase (NAD+)
VLAVGKFKTEEEAIELANSTTYGLGAGLHSSTYTRFRLLHGSDSFLPGNANQCVRVAAALEAGTVWINQYNVCSYPTEAHCAQLFTCSSLQILTNNVPFGGKKQSGIGRELGSYALDEYTSVKAVHWNFGEKLDWPL